ncbi:TetR family transcriptional regulator [Streptomyces sp. NPDC048448]|uniref:TetR family transcriptional regulator n=1 Tax=Streptomyces sp. NPDC048448 TaxID=3365554 RepID=UPI003715D802
MVRQERAIRTRRAILNAAASVFDERGYEAATIGEVLTRAGVTKGALYFHFPSKQALAEGVLAEQFSGFTLAPRASKLQELVDMGLSLAYRMRRNPVGAIFGTWTITTWLDATEKVLREAREQGELLPHVDPAESAWVFSAAWTGVQVYSHTLAGREDLERRVSALFEHLLPSIAVPAVLGKLVTDPARAAEVAAEGERLAAEAGELGDLDEVAAPA